jgi:RNA polymerase sigma-70 factor (ECF subfamily)
MVAGSGHSTALGATMHTDVTASLIDRLRGGDAVALEELMERFAPRVHRLAFGITRNEADAEEVVQDVFLRLFRKIDAFEGRSALGTWIYRIAVNTALIKRRGKRAALEVLIEDHLPTFKEDGHREGDRAMLLADWSETPEAELLSSEVREIVRNTIAGLPDPYRIVLLLRDMEELSNEETAEILEDTVASVKSRLHRARMALREQLTRSFAAGGSTAARPTVPAC